MLTVLTPRRRHLTGIQRHRGDGKDLASPHDPEQHPALNCVLFDFNLSASAATEPGYPGDGK